MAVSILTTPQSIGRAKKRIDETQDGLCYDCKKPFSEDDKIVARSGWTPKYYHKPCAKRLKII